MSSKKEILEKIKDMEDYKAEYYHDLTELLMDYSVCDQCSSCLHQMFSGKLMCCQIHRLFVSWDQLKADLGYKTEYRPCEHYVRKMDDRIDMEVKYENF